MTTTKRAPRKPPAEPGPDNAALATETPKPAKYVAVRKLTVAGRVVNVGEPVPEAETWPRVESWVRHRYIKEA